MLMIAPIKCGNGIRHLQPTDHAASHYRNADELFRAVVARDSVPIGVNLPFVQRAQRAHFDAASGRARVALSLRRVR